MKRKKREVVKLKWGQTCVLPNGIRVLFAGLECCEGANAKFAVVLGKDKDTEKVIEFSSTFNVVAMKDEGAFG